MMALVKEAHKSPISTKMSLEIEDSNSLRQIRNRAEKQRRDRLNGYLAELATMVPMVKNAAKPLDKVSILRLAAAHLRLNKSCLNSKLFQCNIPTLPSTINLEEFEKYIGGFLIAVTFSGVVVFCSKCIEDYLGYQNIDLMGHYVCNFVHKKQAPYLEKKIRLIASQYKKGDFDKMSKVMQLHLLQRPLPRSNEVKYQKMKLKLSVHNNETLVQSCNPETIHSSPEDILPQKSKDFGTSAVILIFVEPLKHTLHINVDKPLEIKDTYFTIHGLKSEIIYSDQRISTITGYLPSDVIGSSAYQFIYEPDIPIALFAQKAMFTSEDGIGLIVYRLKIFGSKYIYLQSKGQLVYKEKSTEISHFICCNQWLSEKEGDKRLKRFHNRFAPQIELQKKRDACNTKKTVFSEVTYQPTIKENVNESYSNEDLRLDSVIAMDKIYPDTSTIWDTVAMSEMSLNFVNTEPQNTGKVLTESVVDGNIISRISAPEYFNQSISSNEVYGANCNSHTIETSQYVSKPSYQSCLSNNTLTGGNAISASGEVQFVDNLSSEINRLIESNYLSNMQNQNVNCEVKNNVLLYPGKGQPEFASLQFQKQELPNSNSANWNFQGEGNRQTPRSCEHSREFLECPSDSNFQFTASESQPPQFAQNILINDWMKTQSIDHPPYLNSIQCNELDNVCTSTYVQNSMTSYSDVNEYPSPVMVSDSVDSMDVSTLDNISFVSCDTSSLHRNLKRNAGCGKLEVQGSFQQNNFSTSIPIKKLRTSDFVKTNPNGLDTVLVPFQENGNSSENHFNVDSSVCNDIFDSDSSKQVFNELNTFFNTLPLTPSMQSSHIGLGKKF